MDEQAAIALILVVDALGYALHLAADRWVHAKCEIVLFGVSSGVAAPLAHRRLVLWHGYVVHVTGGTGFFVLGAFGLYCFSLQSSGLVQAFAWISAMSYALVAFAWASLGTAYGWYMHNFLKKAEAAKGSP